MHRRSSNTLIVVMIAIVGLVSLPIAYGESVRGLAAVILTPIWERALKVKLFFQLKSLHANPPSNGESNSGSMDERVQRLQLENQLLAHELSRLEDLFHEEHLLCSQFCEALMAMPPYPDAKSLSDKHGQQMQKLFEIRFQAIPARIIYRSQASWNSSLWVNVGSEANNELNSPVVAKNSPVLVGASVLGVIDYVGAHQSRVKLLIDSGLNPSVRALRGGGQNRLLAEQVESLIEALAARQDLYPDTQKRSVLGSHLMAFRDALGKDAHSWLIAKGEIRGSKRALWRTHQYVLQGVGFNYDFSDEEGPARDLRSGKPKDRENKGSGIPILRVHDLLVTTGMDGVFPPGLRVGTVTKIQPLKEGDYTYELEAKPAVGNFDDLSLVFILPPWGYNALEEKGE